VFVLFAGATDVSGSRVDVFPKKDWLPLLLAAPRGPVTKAQLVYAEPNSAAYGAGPAGEVAISARTPVVLLSDSTGTDAIVIGIEGAAFARFSFAVITRELVNTDWVFAVPLVWHRGSHWLRLRYYHTSSHLGDEYQQRFGLSSINYSRDGVDFVGFVRPRAAMAKCLGLGLYAGGLWSPNSHPEEGVVYRGRMGVELDPFGGERWRPYVALDAEREAGAKLGSRMTAQSGIWLPRVQGQPLRLALEFMQGPSAMGQFTQRTTRRVALGLFWNP